MNFLETKAPALDHDPPSDEFLTEMANWGHVAPEGIFATRPSPIGRPDPDIYVMVKPELGPWDTSSHDAFILHRKAVMLETMRVLTMFESDADWTEGVDTSKLGPNTPENAEAGAWQVSYDSRTNGPELVAMLDSNNVHDGVTFQRVTKFQHVFAMEYVARLMRLTHKHNGPLYKGDERIAIRKSLRGPEHSVYPWLSRDAVQEWITLIS